MVTGDLFDAAITDLVEARVADVTNHGRPILDDRDRQHACHALPLGASGCKTMNLIVGNGDRFANALAKRSSLALQPLSQHAECDVGSFAASCLSADTVDDDEQPARFVNVETILVDLTLKAGIGGTGGRDRAERRHFASSAAPRFQ